MSESPCPTVTMLTAELKALRKWREAVKEAFGWLRVSNPREFMKAYAQAEKELKDANV